ncbi:MAG: hypothetical protein WCE21_01240 [Candidatus Babeliales bacterium]
MMMHRMVCVLTLVGGLHLYATDGLPEQGLEPVEKQTEKHESKNENSGYQPGKALFDSIKKNLQNYDSQEMLNVSLGVSGACAIAELMRGLSRAGAALVSDKAAQGMIKSPRISGFGLLSTVMAGYGLTYVEWGKVLKATNGEELNALIPRETWEAFGAAALTMGLRALTKPRLLQFGVWGGLSAAAFVRASQQDDSMVNSWLAAAKHKGQNVLAQISAKIEQLKQTNIN